MIKHIKTNSTSTNKYENGPLWDETAIGNIYHVVGEASDTYWLRTEFDLVPFWYDGHQWDLYDAPYGACAEFQTNDEDEGTIVAYEYTANFINNAIKTI